MLREPVAKARRTTKWLATLRAASPGFSSISRTILSFSLLVMMPLLVAAPASAEPTHQSHLGEQLALSENPVDAGLRPLDVLMTVPDPVYIWIGETTDADLAYAVSLGNDPDLEKRNPFRKHNFDLFRTERPVIIGRQEMVLRFRVRAKSRNTMSVELRF